MRRAHSAGFAPPYFEEERLRVDGLYARLRAADARLVGPEGKPNALPGTLDSFLCGILDDLSEGKSVTILQSEATLTTVEAAKFLGVSRQFLIQEIDKRKLPCHRVGTHRRLYVRDVLTYKSKRDAGRRSQLDALALAEYEEGLYARGLSDPKPGQ